MRIRNVFMRKIVLLLLIIHIVGGAIVFADTEKDRFVSENDFDNWVTHYYLSPQPELLPYALKYFCKSNMYNNKVILPMMSFFVAALKGNDTLLKKTYIELEQDSTTREKIFFLDILWLINDTESRKLIENARAGWIDDDIQGKIKQQNKSRPYNVLIMPIISTQALDMLWATFFATGDEKAVQRIISVIHFSKDGKGEGAIIGASALWSLKSNAKQHKKVMDICKQEIGKQTGLTKNLLQEVVAG